MRAKLRKRARKIGALAALWLLGAAFLSVSSAEAARLKDIVSIKGVRSNQLLGYGLVVGLNGTGDGTDPSFTAQSLASLLKKLGINVPAANFKVKNVAAVAVTATLPPFARAGSKLDVTLSSIGDTTSLLGGTLLMTPLRGGDGEVYAVAQGAVSLGGGFAFQGAAGTGVQKNHPTVGTVTNGASVEREIPLKFWKRKGVQLALNNPDFTTVTRVVQVINKSFGLEVARALDAGTVTVNIAKIGIDPIRAVSQLERLEVVTDQRAKVVISERTGTIIMGENVRISTVAISHGNLNIIIREDTLVSQPSAFAPTSATTETIEQSEVTVEEEQKKIAVLPKTVSIGDVVRGLNAIGVSPRDLIAILQALKAAGALDAQVELI